MNDRHSNDDLAAPPKLVAALQSRRQQPLFIPPTLDEAVLGAARRHLEKRPTPGFRWLHLMPSFAAAVVLLIVLLVAQFVARTGHRNTSESLARQDINHDGRVDILDAFALARQLKTGTSAGPELDINGDGVVDEKDAAAIAAQAVKLDRPGRS